MPIWEFAYLELEEVTRGKRKGDGQERIWGFWLAEENREDERNIEGEDGGKKWRTFESRRTNIERKIWIGKKTGIKNDRKIKRRKRNCRKRKRTKGHVIERKLREIKEEERDKRNSQ